MGPDCHDVMMCSNRSDQNWGGYVTWRQIHFRIDAGLDVDQDRTRPKQVRVTPDPCCGSMWFGLDVDWVHDADPDPGYATHMRPGRIPDPEQVLTVSKSRTKLVRVRVQNQTGPSQGPDPGPDPNPILRCRCATLCACAYRSDEPRHRQVIQTDPDRLGPIWTRSDLTVHINDRIRAEL